MLKILILFVLAALPVYLICTYIYNKDKNKEPKQLLTSLFTKGIMSCFLVIIVSELMQIVIPFLQKDIEAMNYFEVLFYSFIGVALVEECCKWYYVHNVGYKSRAFDEKYDIIVYSVFVSLGFAFFENVLYVFGNQSVLVALTRAILAVPGHACDAIFMGYYLTLAKQANIQKNKELETKNKIKSILVPTILHGIYDFCLFVQDDNYITIFFAFVVILYIASVSKIKKLASTNSNYYYNTNSNVYNGYSQISQINNQQPSQANYQRAQIQKQYCTNCGAVMIGPFCVRCGKRQ